MPIMTLNLPESQAIFKHLGYPGYFGTVLAIFKLFGGLTLIIPKIPARIKEWAYAGFTFDFIFAAISFTIVEGSAQSTIVPFVALAFLVVSYVTYHRIKA